MCFFSFGSGVFDTCTILDDGSLMVAGGSHGPDYFGRTLWMLLLDSNLEVRWDYLSDDPGIALSLAKTDGGFVMSGNHQGAWFAEAVMCPR